MKLSEETKEILKNFCGINNSIYFKGGNSLSTISVTNNIFAKAEITEDFPIPFAIYDLSQFLGGMSLFNDPTLDFDNASYMLIKNGRSKVKYFFADPDVIAKPPEKDIQLPEHQFSFQLTDETLTSLLKGARVYDLPDLCLESEGGEVSLVVKDKDNDTSNSVLYQVGESEVPFKFNFKIENIRIIPGTYNVEVSQRVARFTNNGLTLEYYIALEPDSTFG
tara:strand:- start:321 stop:983 length:663 start_codon:yes stop_codon:yes gene_type:complete